MIDRREDRYRPDSPSASGHRFIPWLTMLLTLLVIFAVIWGWVPVPDLVGRIGVAMVAAGIVVAVMRWLASRSSRRSARTRALARQVRGSAARSAWTGSIDGLSADQLPAAAGLLNDVSGEYATESIDTRSGVVVMRKLPGIRSYGSAITVRPLDDEPEFRYTVSSEPIPRTILLDFGESKRDVVRVVSALRTISAQGAVR